MSLGENSLVAAYQGKGQLKSRPSGTRVVTFTYFDHDALMHHPMHVLDAPVTLNFLINLNENLETRSRPI